LWAAGTTVTTISQAIVISVINFYFRKFSNDMEHGFYGFSYSLADLISGESCMYYFIVSTRWSIASAALYTLLHVTAGKVLFSSVCIYDFVTLIQCL